MPVWLPISSAHGCRPLLIANPILSSLRELQTSISVRLPTFVRVRDAAPAAFGVDQEAQEVAPPRPRANSVTRDGIAANSRNMTADMTPGAVAKLAKYSWRDNPRRSLEPVNLNPAV